MELGLLRGFYLLILKKRGTCEVRGVGPNRGMAAAQGLGFQVLIVQFKDAGYWHILSTPEFAPKILACGPGTYRRFPPNISVIFTNAASLSPSSG